MERLFQSVLLLSELFTNLYIHTPKVTRFIDIFTRVSDCVCFQVALCFNPFPHRDAFLVLALLQTKQTQIRQLL